MGLICANTQESTVRCVTEFLPKKVKKVTEGLQITHSAIFSYPELTEYGRSSEKLIFIKEGRCYYIFNNLKYIDVIKFVDPVINAGYQLIRGEQDESFRNSGIGAAAIL